MKKFYLLAALGSLLLTSCGGNSTSDLNEISDASTGDSLLFYYGRDVATDFWREADGDSTLRLESSREDYLRGVKAGLSAVRDNDAYNQGIYVGLQVATNLRELKRNYPDLEIDDQVFLSAMRAALENDSVVDAPQNKADFYRLLDHLARTKEKSDTEKARVLLKETAEKLGMNQISEFLYGKAVTQGSGPILKDGDVIELDITAAFANGQMVGMSFPKQAMVGRNYQSPIISEALRTMKVGETKQFIASPVQLTPRRYHQGEYSADRVIKFTIFVKSLVNPDASAAVPSPASSPAE